MKISDIKSILILGFILLASLCSPVLSQCTLPICAVQDCGPVNVGFIPPGGGVSFCEDANVTLNNQSATDFTFYIIDWSDGERDTVYNKDPVTHQYMVPDSLLCNGDIPLQVCFQGVLLCNGDVDQSCAWGSYGFLLRVRPKAEIDVDFQHCITDPVNFINASCNGDEYIWTFGDGGTSTEEDPSHTYSTAGLYNVTLIVINDCGSDTTNQVIQVVGDPLAEVQWSADDSVICVNQVVQFQDITTTVGTTNWTITPPDTTGTIWCFTDTLMTLNSPFIEVQFKQVRQYDLKLTARNACGISMWNQRISVIDTPTVSLLSDTLCALNAIYTPDVSYTDSNHILSFMWTFVGGTPETSPLPRPTIVFNSDESHNVSLHITSECGDTTVYTTVVVQSPPMIVMPMVDSLYCTGSDPVTLVAFPEPGFWTGAGIDSNGLFSPMEADTGIHILTYTAGPIGCEASGFISVKVVSSISVTVQEDTVVCQDAPDFLLYASPPGGIWTGSGIVDDIGIFSPQMSDPGTHFPSYTFNDINTCTIIASAKITVDSLPNVSILASASVCNQDFENDLSDVLNLSISPSSDSIIWRVNGTLSNGTFNGQGMPGFHIIEIDVYRKSCVVRDTAVIEVVAPQDLVISEDDTVCISEGFYQLAFNLPSGIWSGNGINSMTGLIDLSIAGGGDHGYTYIYEEGSSCERRDSVTITINDPGLDLNAGMDVSLCENSVVTYTFNSPTPPGGIWSGEDLQDTILGTVQVSNLKLDTIYKYVYCLADQAVAGCSACDTLELIVHALPDPNFQIAGSTCIDEIFTASANDCVTSSMYQWNFGHPGGSASGCNPMHAYGNSGDYTVVLQVESQYGCTNSATVIVHVTEPPNAHFEVDITEGCAPLSVMVFDSSSGENLQFQWVVASDTIAGMNPGNLVLDGISNDSIFLIELIVSNQCDVSKDSAAILVHPYPDVYFGFNVSSGCSPLLIEFGDSTHGNPDMWFWDLGNDSTYTDSIPPSQIYTTPDDSVSIYIVQLIASNMCGVDSLSDTITVYPPDVRAFIELDDTVGCEPLLINPVSLSSQGANIFWQIIGPKGQVTGIDNIVAPQFLLEEPGNYLVILTAARCGEHVDTASVTVLPAPLVLFESEDLVCLGDTVSFINHSQGVAGTQWSFGDGDSSSLFNPTHVYSNPGMYSVVLSATSSSNGCPASHTEIIEITGPPDILVNTTPLSGCEPYYATFTNSGDQNLSYIWNFGDSTPNANAFSPEHIFMNPGSYTVQVFAFNAHGCESDTLQIPVDVWPLPIVDFAFTKAQECGIPLIVQFLNNTSGATSYNWDFGDGQMSNLMHPAHTYLSDGNFDVHMIAVTSNGCLDSGQVIVPVFLQPISAFTVLSPYTCQGTTLQLSNTSTSANTYCWFLNGDLISTEVIPSTVFETPGLYDITLISKYNDLCQDTLTITDGIEILSSPIADFTFVIDQDANILGDVQFYNQSSMFDRVHWDFGDGTQSEELDPWHEYDLNRSIPVTLIAFEDNDGKLTCTDTIIQFIDPEWLITFYAPNAFSPDHGEELVRVFKPVGTGIQEYDISVYSPWGQRVWQSSLLDDHQPVESWNGRLNSTGDELPQGAFTWYARVVFVNGESRVYHGSVTILR